MAALVISMGVLAYGYDSAFIGTTIATAAFKRDFGLTHMSVSEANNVNSNLTSICMLVSYKLYMKIGLITFRFRRGILRCLLRLLFP